MNAVTGEQVRAAMAAKNITYVEHHDCSMCGYMTNYRVYDGQLYFDPGCDCTRGRGLERRPFDDAADWINIQSNDTVRAKLMKAFGLTVEDHSARDAVGEPADLHRESTRVEESSSDLARLRAPREETWICTGCPQVVTGSKPTWTHSFEHVHDWISAPVPQTED